jgi:hypothetical protein
MGEFSSLGLNRVTLDGDALPAQRLVVEQRPLQYVMTFLGCDIHDVVNDPIVKNQVYGYFKLHRQVWRTSEIVDLERWWNRRG